ncbi:hypothetical protein IAU59_000693 [Kwoniella sp. CBS 9459]
MSHSSSHSSLLQMNRPDSLLPQLPASNEVVHHQAQAHWLEQHEQTQQQLCRSKGSGSDLRLAASQQDLASVSASSSSPLKSRTSSQSNSQFSRMLGSTHLQPIASSSSGLNYLNMEPTSSPSCEYAQAALPSPMAEMPDNRQQCAKLLANACVGVMGEALDKSKWQPDEDSALCTYPLCTANFAQATYFFLGPRRHHCRMCGQLFCATHSAQRGALVQTDGQGKRRVVKERVCDLCCQKTDPADIELPRSAQHSRRNSSATESDQHSDLVTPLSEDGHLLSGSALLRAHSRVNLALEGSSSIIGEAAELAPIAEWMDRSGVLSLYPLAVKPSHTRSRRSLSPAPSAGPLFAPSISARREAKEKELERMTLRQRRMGADSDFWLPGKWGYKREDFDPSFLRDGEDEEEPDRLVGGVVEDGPIRFRMGTRKATTPGAVSVRG